MKVETCYKDRPVVFKWLSFDDWTSCSGMFFIRERVYKDGKWTPYVNYYKRYKSWFGYFKSSEDERQLACTPKGSD